MSNSIAGASYNTSYSYTNLGQIWQGPLNGTGTSQQYLYCNSSEPHQLTSVASAGSTCPSENNQTYAATYDVWGNEIIRTTGGMTDTLTYDHLDELVQWDWDTGQTDEDKEFYAYTSSGERGLEPSGITITVYAFGLLEEKLMILVLLYILFPTFELAFILSTIYLIKQHQKELVDEQKLRTQGMETQGTVIKQHRPAPWLMPSIVYHFQHEGTTYQKREFLTYKDFKRNKDETTLLIHYIPDNPRCSHIHDCLSITLYLYPQRLFNNISMLILLTIALIAMLLSLLSNH